MEALDNSELGLIGDFETLTYNHYDSSQIDSISEKKANQLTKAQKKERARQKAQDYKELHIKDLRKTQKHKKLEALLNSFPQNMSQEDITQEIKRLKRYQKEGEQRLKEACKNDNNSGKIVIDLAYSQLMKEIEIKSLASQMMFSVFELRKFKNPMALHVVGFNDEKLSE